MPKTHLLVVEAPAIASQARPGQFCMVHCGEGYFLRRPISVHQVSQGLALLVRVVGYGTAWLAQRQPGEEIDIIGPLGNGFSVLPDARNLLLVAGGIGIAPLAFLAQMALFRQSRNSVTLLLGARTKEEVYPLGLLSLGLNVVVATEDGSQGREGLATDFLGELASQADQVFACGPIDMYKAMSKVLGSKPTQVSLEVRMGCGIGACYACTIPTLKGPRQVCRDGPVFDLSDILWDKI